MSKSRGNVVNPEEVVEKFGADTLRTYLCFMGPYDATMPWSYQGLEGVWRFLNRIWRIYQQKEKIADKTSKELVISFHQTIKKVTEDINRLAHNTAISALMEFVNLWQKPKMVLGKKEAGEFLKLLAPFAPHLTEELWVEVLGNKFSIHPQPWPKYNPQLVVEKEVVVVVQINGKVRGQIRMEREKAKIQEEVEKLAKDEPRVIKYLDGRQIRKLVFVPEKLINFVI